MNGQAFRFAAITVLTALGCVGLAAVARVQPERPEVTRLVATSSSTDGVPQRALLSGVDDDQIILWERGQLLSLHRDLARGQWLATTPPDVVEPNAVARDQRGRTFVAIKNTLRIFAADGREIRSFPIPLSDSLMALPNGDFAVASPTVKGLIHVYSALGAQRNHIGAMKDIDPHSLENQFLNRGIVLPGPDAGYIYVFSRAPRPSVQRFSASGELLLEFDLEGASLNLQLENARTFLASRRLEDVGGFTNISAADFDERRGTLFVATGGRTGWEVVYEYTLDGVKRAEYNLSLPDGSEILRPTDLVSRGNRLNILDERGGIHVFALPAPERFARSQRLVRQGLALVGRLADAVVPVASAREAPCATYVTVPDCHTDACSVGGPRDCKAAMCASANCQKVVSHTCGPTTAIACSLTVITCTVEDGQAVNVNHGPLNLACPTDVDGDGYTPDDGSDCDDGPGSAHIHPGASLPTCEEHSQGDWNCNGMDDGNECQTPIVIDIRGDGFRFTNKANGVMFDLLGNGVPQRYSWTSASADDVWLAMDRNGNGRIDSGKELWGAPTEQPPSHSRNGYIALAEYDLPRNGGNDDEVIDASDAVFTKLLLWRDANHDGVSQSGELSPLLGSTITSIALDYREFQDVDLYGNWFRYKSPANVEQRRLISRTTCDVYLWAK